MVRSLHFLIAYSFVFLIIFLVIYILIGIFLNKLNKLIYGKGTPMAFIPFANIYLLGKLTLGKPVGLILIILNLLCGTYTVEINGYARAFTILPGSISYGVSMLINIIIFGLFIYAIYLYFKIKKEKSTYIDIDESSKDDGDIIGKVITNSKDDNTDNN